jgi:hypothetical protein
VTAANVKVEPRSNNAIAAGNSSFAKASGKGGTGAHQQKLDLARHPEKASGATKQMRAKDRPLINDFVTDEEFGRLLRAWFNNAVRVLEPGRGFYIWGGYANVANYPPALVEAGLYFSQAIIWHKLHPVLTRKDFMGDHEWCFYGWKEGGRAQVFRAQQRARRLAGQKGQPPEHGPFDGKAGGGGRPGDAVLVAARGAGAEHVRRLMHDTKATWSSRVTAATQVLKFAREAIELDDLSVRIETLERNATEEQP